MIQLKETDFLWKCYKRYYDDMLKPPVPGSICNFWWKSVGGMVKWLFWDCPFFIIGPIAFALTALCIWGSIALDAWVSFFPGILFFALCVATGLFSLFLIIFRYGEYWDNKGVLGKWMQGIGAIGIGTAVLSFIFSFMWRDALNKGGPWLPIYVLWGFLTVLSILVLLAVIVASVYCFSNHSTSGKVVRAYLGSFKSWVCPLVKAPWEESDGKDKTEEQVREVPRPEQL